MNATMRKFGAPASRIRGYGHWTVLLRPAQVTLGSLILAAHDTATAFSQLSRASFAELRMVAADLEQALSRAFSYEKLNYLMLMMVDPDVHFHVIPRYSGPKHFEGREFLDYGWPGPPDLTRPNQTEPPDNFRILAFIASMWG
ncbi:MAG: HIT family protein [Gammaproteobacteria bacterium]